MCFGKADEVPTVSHALLGKLIKLLNSSYQHYRIDRLDDPSTPGHHYRSRTSIERHLASAPMPPIRPSKNRYPKAYNNFEGQFPKNLGQLHEYPSKPYAYGHLQNAKGRAKMPYTGGETKTIGPGYTRTITTQSKRIVGVNYHPDEESGAHSRATEGFKKPGKPVETAKHYDHPKSSDGKRVKRRV